MNAALVMAASFRDKIWVSLYQNVEPFQIMLRRARDDGTDIGDNQNSTTTDIPTLKGFPTGQMLFLPLNQQCQSTEGWRTMLLEGQVAVF